MLKNALLFCLTALTLLPTLAHAVETPAPIAGQDVFYNDGDVELQGYYVPARCGDLKASYPTVLVVHQWKGLSNNEKMRAEMLSRQCYNAFAIDIYGKGIRPKTMEAAGAESSKYKKDTPMALSRMNAALDFVKTKDGVDANNIAAIGYCFGGGLVLELARSGADVTSVTGFHADLKNNVGEYDGKNVKAMIALHHGADDPYVPDTEVNEFKEEMKLKDIDYNFHAYENAVHSFTQIESGTDNSKGAAYNLNADRKSWAALLEFLDENFTQAEK